MFLDNAYQTFLLIQNNEIVVNANRWPVVILRVLPLIVVKGGGSIKLILLALSMSYMLFQLAIYATIRFYNKDRLRSWLFLSLIIIPVAHSFYWCNSELITGLSIVVLLISCIEKERRWLSILILLILPWVHPLLLVIVVFILGYYFFFEPAKRLVAISYGVIYAAMTIVKSLYFQNWYDTEKNRILIKQLEEYSLSSHYLEYILRWEFWPVVASMICCIAICLFYKKYTVLSYYLLTTAAYLLLQDIMIRNYDNVFYHEVSYLLIFLWSAYLIQKQYKLETKRLLLGIGLLLFTMGFVRIIMQGIFYTDRIEWYQAFLSTHDREIIEYDKSKDPQLIMEWGSPYESILISSMAGRSRTILFAANPKDFVTRDSVFISHYGQLPLSELNDEYFDLEPIPYKETAN